MHRRLTWNAIGFESKTKLLLEHAHNELSSLSEEPTKKREKVQGLIDELDNIYTSIGRIKDELIPKLESIFRVKFKTPELILLALSRPSLRVIFDNLEKRNALLPSNPLRPEEYADLKSVGDAGDALALIGDAILSLAIVELFWDTSLSTVGDLTKKRASIASNQNLAKICDQWGLMDYRIKRLPVQTENDTKQDRIIHEKGTLIEAIYGVVYVEFEYGAITRLVSLLQ